MTAQDEAADRRLKDWLARKGRLLVAFSGGVDSTFLAFRAFQVLGQDSLAVLAQSAAVPPGEIESAQSWAGRLGLPLEIVNTHELDNPAYTANSGDRCFHCKSELFTVLGGVASRHGFADIAYGAITDDLSDYRPGARAAQQFGVLAPLQDVGLDKAAIRRLSQHYQLPTWNQPASPCLASRIAYGESVTPEKLHGVLAAETALRGLGLKLCRVRHHREVARIEVPLDDFPRLLEPQVMAQAVAAVKAAGFLYATLDLEGLRSGSLNLMLPVVQG